MKNLLLSQQLFIHTVELGGLAPGANHLNISEKKASSLLLNLERELGRTLFFPSEHFSQVTRDGWELFNSWKEHVHNLEKLAQTPISNKADYGFLKIGFPTTVGATLFISLLARFSAQHPNLRFDIELIKVGAFHPMWNGFDLRVVHEDYSLENVEQVPLGKIRRTMVASPFYLSTHPDIKKPSDLTKELLNNYLYFNPFL